MRIIEHILSTIAPHECLGCKQEGFIICASCSEGMAGVPPRCYRCQRNSSGFRTCRSCRAGTPLYSVQPLTAYEGIAKDLVYKLKYERLRSGADTMAALLAAHLPKYPEDVIVTHVPTASSRVRARGYDQAEWIARRYALLTGLEHAPLLARFGQQRQVGQNRQHRQEQMRHLFMPLRPHKIPNSTILLIDDVVTTGATIEACARILKTAGAKRVSAAVFAVA